MPVEKGLNYSMKIRIEINDNLLDILNNYRKNVANISTSDIINESLLYYFSVKKNLINENTDNDIKKISE